MKKTNGEKKITGDEHFNVGFKAAFIQIVARLESELKKLKKSTHYSYESDIEKGYNMAIRDVYVMGGEQLLKEIGIKPSIDYDE